MRRTLVFLSFAVIASTAFSQIQSMPERISTKPVENVTVEDLAHSFFFHSSRPADMLRWIISERSVSELTQWISDHKDHLNDRQALIEKAQSLCDALQAALTGDEFAAAFIAFEEQERADRQRTARHLLMRLEPFDRAELERWLDEDFRRAATISRLDYETMFALGPFPSTWSETLTQRVCSGPAELERRAAP